MLLATLRALQPSKLHRVRVASARTIGVLNLHRAASHTSDTMGQELHPAASKVLEFWFGAGCTDAPVTYSAPPELAKMWFMGGAALDEEIKAQFGADLAGVAVGKYDPWLEHPYNAMAAIILMDQFSRNVYRGTPQAFALDTKAVTWARHLLASGRCDALPFPMRFFLLVPFMHQESLAAQEEGVALFAAEVVRAQATPGVAEGQVSSLSNGHKYMGAHRDVVAKWGRFPHRNALLGRESTAEEAEGLAAGTIAKF